VSTNTQFNIPISKGRNASITLPRDGLKDSDFNQIRSWIDMFEDVLGEEAEKPASYLQPRRGVGQNPPPADPPPKGGLSQ
jgi:hypothetical protein